MTDSSAAKTYHHNYKIKAWMWILGIVVFIVIGFVGAYNSLVSMDEGVKTAWSQVETVYQRRVDLIPNLIATVKGNTQQEKDVFTFVAEARSKYTSAASPEARIQAAGVLEGGLSRLMAIVENYPDLKSSQAFQDLMTQLEGTENRISTERGRYNETVNAFNSSIRRFPKSIIAGMFGFKAYERFKADEGAEVVPEVKF